MYLSPPPYGSHLVIICFLRIVRPCSSFICRDLKWSLSFGTDECLANDFQSFSSRLQVITSIRHLHAITTILTVCLLVTKKEIYNLVAVSDASQQPGAVLPCAAF